MLEAVVGSSAAEKVLLYLQAYDQAYGREIAATFGVAQSQVQKQLRKLEYGGVLVSRLSGRTRLYQWKRRNPLVAPLRALFDAALKAMPASERKAYFRERKRPRRSGKPL